MRQYDVNNHCATIQKVWKVYDQIKARNDAIKDEGEDGVIYRTSDGYFAVSVQSYFQVGHFIGNRLDWIVLAVGDFKIEYLRGISEKDFLAFNLDKVFPVSMNDMLIEKFLMHEKQLKNGLWRLPKASGEVAEIYTDGEMWLRVFSDKVRVLGRIGCDWKALLNVDENETVVHLKDITEEHFMIQ